MPRRSIGFPLALGIVLALLTAALAVGWQVLLVGDWRPVAQGLTTLHWVLIVLGSLFFVMVIAGRSSAPPGPAVLLPVEGKRWRPMRLAGRLTSTGAEA